MKGDDRFIPVKSDDLRILTCLLEYFPQHVRITDLLQEMADGKWQQKVSSCSKMRIAPDEVERVLVESSMQVIFNKPVNRLINIIAIKK